MIPLLGTVLPLALLGAVSPLIFVTVSTLLAGRGRGAALRYALGAALVLALVVALGAGLLGAGLTSLVERELASRVVDGVLGVLLLGYAVLQARSVRRDEHAPHPAPGSRDGDPFPLGVTAMATNFTTLPLLLSAGQHVGAARLPLAESLPVLLLVVLLALTPAWLPLVLGAVAPRLLERRRPRRGERRPSPVGQWLPVLACLLGAGLLLGRAFHLLS